MPFLKNNNLRTFTWTTKPAAAAYIGQAFISDVGVNGSVWYSNGVIWGIASPLVVFQPTLPIMVPPSSYIADNGALTIGTQPAGSLVFSATSGAGVTVTGTATGFASTDVNRVITCDGGKQALITAFTSTTLITVTITGTLSTTTFANLAWWLGTPLQEVFTSSYMRFPANAIVAGSAAGLYYVTMTNSTTGTIFNNTYSSGVPTIPGSPTAFSTTGPGAYTQTTSDVTTYSFTLKGGLMGASGSLHSIQFVQQCNTAGTKTTRVAFGGTNVYSAAIGTGTLSVTHVFCDIFNRGVTNKQLGTPSNISTGSTATSADFTKLTKDTTADQVLSYIATIGTVTDWVCHMSAQLCLVNAN